MARRGNRDPQLRQKERIVSLASVGSAAGGKGMEAEGRGLKDRKGSEKKGSGGAMDVV